MSDWEEELEELETPPVDRKWDDEDAEDDLKEDWEDSDEEAKPQKKNEAAASPVKKKVPLAQKIADRNAAEEKKRQELEARRSQLQPQTEEDKFEQREREKRLQEESDLKNAADLFKGMSTSEVPLEQVTVKTKAEFDAYAKRIVEVITKHSNSSRYYTGFVEEIVREISRPLPAAEVNTVLSALTRVANEKQRAESALKSKKKSKNPALAGSNKAEDRVPTRGVGALDNYDDFDDFM